MEKYRQIFAVVALIFILTGCASVRPRLEKPAAQYPSGIYYEVKRGDTLWRVSKLYDVSVNDIVNANRLPDSAKISVGQKIFIPRLRDAGNEPQYKRDATGSSCEVKFIWPVLGKVVSCFGAKKGLITNKGIDIEAVEGNNVVAADDGLISFVDENMKGLGKTVIIDHGNGFSTVYAHNSEILINLGEEVKKNQIIARAGRTGRANGPYLHFEVRKGHEPQDPLNYLESVEKVMKSATLSD